MVEIPETRYARNGPISIAYQVVGGGALDVLYLAPGISHLDYGWRYPPYVDHIDRFTSYSRLVLFDKRGCGLSDRTVEAPTIPESVSDAVAVLDSVGVGRVHLFGVGEGASAALALAAAHPDRVAKVAVYGAICCAIATDDFPWAAESAESERLAPIFDSDWGGSDLLAALAPNHADDPALARWFSGMNRAGVSPAGAAALHRRVEEFFTGTRPTRTPSRALATVVFTDIVHSTEKAADLGDEAWRVLLARHDDLTRQHLEQHDGRVVKSTGGGALATFDDPEDAIAAVQGLIADLAGAGLDLRVGIHSGKIEITGDDVAGIAVHLASRISALAGSGDIYVSRTIADLLLGSGVEFDDRGTHDLKGIPGQWEILAVAAPSGPS